MSERASIFRSIPQESANKMNEAVQNDLNYMDGIGNQIGKIVNGTGQITNPPEEKEPTVEEILEKYSATEIASTSNSILMKVLQNPTTESINKMTSSKEAMKLLGENTLAKKEIIKSNEWCKAIANSEYRSDFSEYIVYNEKTLVASGGGRNYYKSQDGFALSVIFNITGDNIILAGKEENAVKGWSSYDPNYIRETYSFEDEDGELWYCAAIPYTWTDGATFNSYKGKDIGKITINKYPEFLIEAAKKAVKDFLYGE